MCRFRADTEWAIRHRVRCSTRVPQPISRDARHRSGSWNGKLHGTITAEADGWLAYVRLEDPPGLSPISTVGRYATAEEALIATDEVWPAR